MKERKKRKLPFIALNRAALHCWTGAQHSHTHSVPSIFLTYISGSGISYVDNIQLPLRWLRGVVVGLPIVSLRVAVEGAPGVICPGVPVVEHIQEWDVSKGKAAIVLPEGWGDGIFGGTRRLVLVCLLVRKPPP